jgi:hypothetical protein
MALSQSPLSDMLVRDLSKLFLMLAEIAKLHGDTPAALDFEHASRALSAQRTGLDLKDAVNFWRTASSGEPTHPVRPSMTARKAANHLRLVSDSSQLVSAKRGASPLHDVLSLLEAKGDADIRGVFAPRVPATVDYLGLLSGAGLNRVAFGSAIQRLQKDKSIPLEEVLNIVASYTGASARFRSKKAAIAAALEHFEIEAQYAAKAAAIDRLTGSH